MSVLSGIHSFTVTPNSLSIDNLAIDRHILIDLDLFFRGAREKHAIYRVTIWSVEFKYFAVESVLQYDIGLIEAPKYLIHEPEAAELAHASLDLQLKRLECGIQLSNALMIGLRLDDYWQGQSGDEFAGLLLRGRARILHDWIHFVVEGPERDKFASWKPWMHKVQFNLNTVEGLLYLTE